MDSLSLWEASIPLSVVQRRRVIVLNLSHKRKTLPSIQCCWSDRDFAMPPRTRVLSRSISSAAVPVNPFLGVSPPSSHPSSSSAAIPKSSRSRFCAMRSLWSRGSPPERKLGARTECAFAFFEAPLDAGGTRSASIRSFSAFSLGLICGGGFGSVRVNEGGGECWRVWNARTNSLSVGC